MLRAKQDVVYNARGWFLSLLLLFSAQAIADTAIIAVASNFTKTIEVLAEPFEKQTGHQLKFAFGPSGKLYAQIVNGAPFDAFFSADEARPKKLIERGLAVEASYLNYAQGQIALFTINPSQYPVASQPIDVLKAAEFRFLAVANPKTAPYGESSIDFLKAKKLYQKLKPKLVNGESIGNAFRYVATGNAEIGFLALSQLIDPESPLYQKGAYWTVPIEMYKPINQGAVILKRAYPNQAVSDFMAFIKTAQAQEIMQNKGYRTSLE